MANLFGSGGGIPGPLENFAIGGSALGQAGAAGMGLRSPEQQRSDAIAQIRQEALGSASNEQEFLQMMGQGLVRAGMQDESFAILDRLRDIQSKDSDVASTLAGARKDIADAASTVKEMDLIGPKGSLMEADARLRDATREKTFAEVKKVQAERDKIQAEIDDLLAIRNGTHKGKAGEEAKPQSLSQAQASILNAVLVRDARESGVNISDDPSDEEVAQVMSVLPPEKVEKYVQMFDKPETMQEVMAQLLSGGAAPRQEGRAQTRAASPRVRVIE